MGLIWWMFVGTVLGIELMAGWKRMTVHGGSKHIAKVVDVKLLASLSRDDLKKICGDNFPEWISFPVFEQVKWINKQLSKLWPFVVDPWQVEAKKNVSGTPQYCSMLGNISCDGIEGDESDIVDSMQAAALVIKESVEPLLEEYRPESIDLPE